MFFCFYSLFNYYSKQTNVQKILEEWVNKTGGGYIKLDDNGNFKGDYYLSITDSENRNAHIHLIEKCNEGDLCYIIKKNYEHSKIFIINQNMSKNEIVNEMIQNYTYFKG
jgi:hypothetical protein